MTQAPSRGERCLPLESRTVWKVGPTSACFPGRLLWKTSANHRPRPLGGHEQLPGIPGLRPARPAQSPPLGEPCPRRAVVGDHHLEFSLEVRSGYACSMPGARSAARPSPSDLRTEPLDVALPSSRCRIRRCRSACGSACGTAGAEHRRAHAARSYDAPTYDSAVGDPRCDVPGAYVFPHWVAANQWRQGTQLAGARSRPPPSGLSAKLGGQTSSESGFDY